MGAVLVAGLTNIETTLRVEGFPIAYAPVCYPFFGVDASVSGVGYNVAKALASLGNPVRFLSLIGRDLGASLVLEQLRADGLSSAFVVQEIERTARSVILYDADGRRMIYVDLKDLQERTYPEALFEAAARDVTLAVLCNINFARPMLGAMQARGVPIATDVHTIADPDDAYNADWMHAASVLFMSDEKLPCAPEDWVRALWNRYDAPVVVIGRGMQGALLAVRGDSFLERVPAVYTRPVVSTIGAGDALFSSFVHVYAATGDPYLAIRRAMVFASYKIGTTGAADGFLSAEELERLSTTVYGSPGN
ncbi:MAG: carbohydrate kinase family protein [Anaerolineae bacterium]|nr:carbohydrate kinase family protein [Anaerolineae bacterium]